MRKAEKMEEIEKIAKKIKENGGNLYLVGGAIRDGLLNLTISHDKDYCVTGMSKEEFQQIFPEAKIQGKDFPVFILENQEFALARKDRKIGEGHKKFEILADKNISIQEDLARRDITINSIAQDVLTKKIIDPFNGKEDIAKRMIRKTTNAFQEDPLRVYRVARFAAVLEFEVEQETLEAMKQLKKELFTLSKERVFAEFQKALASEKPSIFFKTLRKANVLEVHFPEINQLIGKTQPIQYHPEGDSYEHTMIVVDNSAKVTEDLKVRFSCLVHDLGKGTTPMEILPHHYGHDEGGGKLVMQLSNRIGAPNAWIKCGKTACKWHMKAGIFEQMTPKKQVELIENVSNSILGLEGLKIVVACDKTRKEQELKAKLKEINFDKLGRECLIKIDGNYLKQKYPGIQGIEFGRRLHEERVKWIKTMNKSKGIVT